MRPPLSLFVVLLTAPAWAQSLPLPDDAAPAPSLAQVAERWAPDFYQDTDDTNTSADLITPLDFDGDRVMTNNWENMARFSESELRGMGTAYWWGTRTATHDYVGYAVFHPRDWTDDGILDRARRTFGPHVGDLGTGEHENDFEGVLLVIDRATNRPTLMVTQAHAQFWQYGDAADWKERGTEDLDGPIRFDPQTGCPQVFIEAKGHGNYGHSSKTDFDAEGGDGVLYTRAGSSLSSGNGRYAVSYGLQSLTPWFDAFQEVAPGTSNETFTREGGQSSFRGETRDDDSSQPPWGWIDKDYPDSVNRSYWADPARFVEYMFEPTGELSRDVEARTFEQPQRQSLREFTNSLRRLVKLFRLRLRLRKLAQKKQRRAPGALGALKKRLR